VNGVMDGTMDVFDMFGNDDGEEEQAYHTKKTRPI